MEHSTPTKTGLTKHVRVLWMVLAFVIIQLVMHHPAVMGKAQAAPAHQTSSIEQECAEANLVLKAALLLMTQYDDADEARSGLVALAETLSAQRPLMYRMLYAALLQTLADNAELVLANPGGIYQQLKPQVDEACVRIVKGII